MFRTASCLLIGFFVLAGCAGDQLGLSGGQTPKVGYTAPDNPPAKPVSFNLNGSVEEVVAQLVNALDGPRFGITHVNRRKGLITAVYRADPEEFVDCGILDLRPATGQPSQVPAAIRRVQYNVPIRSGYYADVNRNMRLDGRMLIQVARANVAQSRVTIAGDYVVTRSLRLSGKPGDPVSTRRELVDFGSGETGKDTAGKLTCQSNGELESYVLASLRSAVDRGTTDDRLGTVVDPDAPLLTRVRGKFEELSCAPLSARSLNDQDVVITGFVSSDQDLARLQYLLQEVSGIGEIIFRVSVTSQAFCEILDVTVPLKELNGIDQAGAFVSLLNGESDLIEGDFLIVDATAPNFESYVYLFYAQQDGKLVHMLPNVELRDNRVSASERFRLGEDTGGRRYQISGPFGYDMVTMIASTEPLFTGQRPEIEPTTSFARDLTDRIAAAQDAGAHVVADIVFAKTSPRSF
ncbi:MAG: DUF4384 domain-containing protein [Geminicoccaceae bacterium]